MLKRCVAIVLPLMALIVPLTPMPAYAALAGEWHMETLDIDPESGKPQMTDTSGNENHGDAEPTISLTSGYQGNAYDFNPALGPAYVQVPDADSLDPGTSDFTFSAAVNFGVVPETDYNVIRKGLGTAVGGYYKMEIKRKVVNNVPIARARCQFRDNTKATVSLMKGRNLADNTWHVVTCAKTSSSIHITIDGTTYTKNRSLSGTISNGSSLFVGRNEDGDDQYAGFMDEATVTIGS